MDEPRVKTCAGADEGAFAWLTLNYLLGHLGKEPGQTIAAIDLGGGSVQQAFAIPEADAASAPEGYITQLSGGGRTYHVYVHRCAAFFSATLGIAMLARVFSSPALVPG
jgi:apyrase